MGMVMDSRCSALPVLGVFLMKKVFLTGVAVLLLATGTTHADWGTQFPLPSVPLPQDNDWDMVL
jgi:hypothetical protein